VEHKRRGPGIKKQKKKESVQKFKEFKENGIKKEINGLKEQMA
jgi:hypothetical protein